jgi:peptide/nickel transport system permease protein/oligopeptide transport system permease protein
MKSNNGNKNQKGQSLWQDAWKRLKRNNAAMIGLVMVILFVIVAITAPLLAPQDPYEIDLGSVLQEPSLQHWLGTDYYGRDLMSRVIYGSRISLSVGIIVQVIALSIGTLMGSLAGYYGGKIDMFIMRIVDIVMSFPSLLLTIAIMVALGPSLYTVFFALGIVWWTRTARIVRSEFMRHREREYVEAAKALGHKDFSIMYKHILPNCLAPLIISFTMGIASSIMAEAGLSFLGLGAQEPMASWGSIINNGLQYLRTAPWYSFFPGLAIAYTVLGFNLLGDGLRDAMDPKMQD